MKNKLSSSKGSCIRNFAGFFSNFTPPTRGLFMIRQVSEEKSFESVDGRRTTEGRRRLPIPHPDYKLSSPGAFGSGELKSFLTAKQLLKFRWLLDCVLAKPIKAGPCRQVCTYYLSDHRMYNLWKFFISKTGFGETRHKYIWAALSGHAHV